MVFRNVFFIQIISYEVHVRSILKIIDVDRWPAGTSARLFLTTVWKIFMTSTDPRQAETADKAVVESHVSDDPEAQKDDAWIKACRAEIEAGGKDDELCASSLLGADSTDLESGNLPNDDKQNATDRAESSVTDAAIEQTGDDAMSKFGHAIGALAKHEDDLDEQALDYAAEMASPSSMRDDAVAPHIAAAERELERSKAGPVDIFDRIAQAAESQFDESRGNTAKRVSELVDDRRVGTKRWTPSKTMKERMAKLEAARAAATGEAPAEVSTPEATAAPEPEVKAASAPTSSQATIVTPGNTAKAAREEKPEVASIAEDEKVTISRRDRKPEIEETIETESTGATLVEDESETEEDADGLRIIPGARGRRRDRARKSRLDEDFEKIFDDEGKPSINSLRRKLRSVAKEESESAEGDATVKAEAEGLAAGSDGAANKGFFSRLLNSNRKKSQKADQNEFNEDELVASFEADSNDDSALLADNHDLKVAEDDNWQDAIDTDRKQKQIAMPIIGTGVAILFGGIGWFAYKLLFGA